MPTTAQLKVNELSSEEGEDYIIRGGKVEIEKDNSLTFLGLNLIVSNDIIITGSFKGLLRNIDYAPENLMTIPLE